MTSCETHRVEWINSIKFQWMSHGGSYIVGLGEVGGGVAWWQGRWRQQPLLPFWMAYNLFLYFAVWWNVSLPQENGFILCCFLLNKIWEPTLAEEKGNSKRIMIVLKFSGVQVIRLYLPSIMILSNVMYSVGLNEIFDPE